MAWGLSWEPEPATRLLLRSSSWLLLAEGPSVKGPAVGGCRFWTEGQTSSSRIAQASAALWGKCPGWGFKGLFSGVPEVQGMLGEGPGHPQAHTDGGWVLPPSNLHPFSCPTTTRPALSATHSCEAPTAVHRPPLEPGASGNAFSSFLPCPPCLLSPSSSSCFLPALPSGLPLASKDLLFPVCISYGPGCSFAAEKAEVWGGRGRGGGEPKT